MNEHARFDKPHFRKTLGHLPTGVSVVTGRGDVGPFGLVIGSFMSVSLDPPLVAVCPALGSTSWPSIAATGYFCVNVLSEHQIDLAQRFAASGGDKFAELSWRDAPSGSPVLEGAVAWIDCRIETVQEAGDHWLVLGRALELDVETGHEPLIFHRGAFERFRRAS